MISKISTRCRFLKLVGHQYSFEENGSLSARFVQIFMSCLNLCFQAGLKTFFGLVFSKFFSGLRLDFSLPASGAECIKEMDPFIIELPREFSFSSRSKTIVQLMSTWKRSDNDF